MRLRNICGADQMIQDSDWVIHEPENQKGNWNFIFSNENPIHIEIGMGKGKFIIRMAKEYPDINFIGIEKYTSVLLRGIQKVEDEKIDNIKFLCIDAENLPNIFDVGEVNKIYLNFSDPWPKDRHAKRRLPSKEFLARYDKILNRHGTIEFKTDNRGLFDFALEELEPAGWNLVKKTYDLHHDIEMNTGNIMTEYEEKFSFIGNPINKYIINR
jgi:tRNA (guanine-N7-)-methyltransferase